MTKKQMVLKPQSTSGVRPLTRGLKRRPSARGTGGGSSYKRRTKRK